MFGRRPNPIFRDHIVPTMPKFAIGTADLKDASVLKKYHSDVWESSAQKPMLYAAYAKGGDVVEHEDGQGKGHRRTLAEVERMDYSYHGN